MPTDSDTCLIGETYNELGCVLLRPTPDALSMMVLACWPVFPEYAPIAMAFIAWSLSPSCFPIHTLVLLHKIQLGGHSSFARKNGNLFDM